MERLLAGGKDVPPAALQRMAQQTEQAMAHMAGAQPDQVAPLMAQAMAGTQDQLRLMDRLQEGAMSGEAQTAWQHATQTAEQAQQMLGAAQGDPARFQQEYQHRHGAMPDQERGQGQKGPQGGQGDPAVTPPATPQQQQEREGAELTPEQERRQEQVGPQGPADATPTPQQHQEKKGAEVTPEQERRQEQAGPQATPEQTPTPQQQERKGAEVTPEQERHQEQTGPQPTPTPAKTGKN
jgi:hypothetical protein